VQDLLDVVEGEATENDETTVEPEVLGEHESAGGGGRENQRSEAGKSDNSDTSEKRATNVEVLVSLGSGTNKGDAAHQADSVETGASEDGGVVKHEGRQEGGLCQVEGGPEGVLGDVAAKGYQYKSRTVYARRLTSQEGTCGYPSWYRWSQQDQYRESTRGWQP
jgi:hypothetical protein